MQNQRLWVALGLVVVGSFAVLGYYGSEIYELAPPVPERIAAEDGTVIATGDDIRAGQNVWQSMGGQEVGSVWGHGAYVAPDWSADWLHREAVCMLDALAGDEHARRYAELAPEQQAALRERIRREYRANTFDPATRVLAVSDRRAHAIAAVSSHYDGLFGAAPQWNALREAYAMPRDSVPDRERRRQLGAFLFWTAWVCATERPGSDVTYTQNWPGEELVGNAPTGATVVWSVLSFVLLLAGIGALAWYHAVQRRSEGPLPAYPAADPLAALRPTPSMRATSKYFWVTAALLVLQIACGAVVAHYGVEGDAFYGFPLSDVLPYSVLRTWHVQLGIFWIATAWLATGLFVAPAVSGHEPRHQRAGVDALFVCLVVIVGGTLFGTWLATRQQLGHEANFWFGHSGYEYVDLGRFWQVFLFVGLFGWLTLMLRALWPALREPSEHRQLLALFALASLAIALFYGAGLLYGRTANLAIAEYWRWWVVHLWVEGFFEVFATTVIAFLFTRMGLLEIRSATRAVTFATVIFLAGGILGTFHHLYFSGTPTAVLALGAMFSALEVVPLTLVGFEAYQNMRLARATAWVRAYRWPILCFVAVSFWNLVGAGLFGFLINPPIALYYMQGLNTTPLHGHAALFGVYGMLGIGLMLFCLRGLGVRREWRTAPVAVAFWSINVGLLLMLLLSLLPLGLVQTWASVEHGMWYARSAEFLQTPLLDMLRWLRVVGDTVFALGALVLGWFVLGLRTGWSLAQRADAVSEAEAGATVPRMPT